MRFEEIRALAFGPFESQVLRFAPGMNVLYGPNESGKSTWHAALYLGLCGMRRSRGKPKAEDKELQDRHKPWDGQSWKTCATVVLDDGRRIELQHDLAGLVNCKAVDLDLGRDCSDQIMIEGSPDGSAWLGLDRRSFLVTACIRQGEMLEVAKHSKLLQEYLQRAAATAGTDATAAEALRALDEFYSREVGRVIANSSKPRPLAMKRKAEAKRSLEEARRQHREFEDVLADADKAERDATARRHYLDLLEARAAEIEMRRLACRLEEAEGLAARFPKPPEAVTESDDLAREVAAVLELWAERPAPPSLTGESSEDLQAELGALPDLPTGDLEPDPALLTIADELQAIVATLDSHRRLQPAAPSDIGGQPDKETLTQLSEDLSIRVPPRDPSLESSADRARRDEEARQQKAQQARLGFIGAGVAATAAIILMAVGMTIPGVMVFGAALLAATWAMIARATGGTTADLASTERALQDLQESIAKAEAQLNTARVRAAELGLPTDAAAIRDLITRLDEQGSIREQHERWALELSRLETEAKELEFDAAEILLAKGESSEPPILASIVAYKTACQQRRNQAQKAARREDLERALQVRLTAEESYRAALDERIRTEDRLREVAERCRIVREDAEELVDALYDWQDKRSADLQRQDKDRREWQRLQLLLDGGSLDDLREQAARARAAYEKCSAELDPLEVERIRLEGDIQAQLANARNSCNQAETHASGLRGSAQERASGMPNVAEAEEALEQAGLEVERLDRLHSTLDMTKRFMEIAQERMHRSIAPVLQESVREALPQVTSGRYADVVVDPENLSVQVRSAQDSTFRDAALLSHGTAEQIFLLLRVALAKHLAKADESCPLLLDDVTVQSDSQRKKAILQTLKTISDERQIILFTQEEEVLDWARQNLLEPQHRIESLLELVTST